MNFYDLRLTPIKALTLASMKARYRKTFIGFIWVVLNPVIMYSVQAFVFHKILKLNVPNYYLFLLGGLLPWIFISSTWEVSTNSLITAGNLLKSFKISPLIIISSQVIDNFINFIAASFIIIIPTALYSNFFSKSLLMLPLSIFILLLFTLFTSYLFSVLNVFFRDLKFILAFAMSILYFLTPIFYPPEYIPETYRWVIYINPIYYIIEPFRACLYGLDIIEILKLQARSIGILAIAALAFNFTWKKLQNEILLKV